MKTKRTIWDYLLLTGALGVLISIVSPLLDKLSSFILTSIQFWSLWGFFPARNIFISTTFIFIGATSFLVFSLSLYFVFKKFQVHQTAIAGAFLLLVSQVVSMLNRIALATGLYTNTFTNVSAANYPGTIVTHRVVQSVQTSVNQTTSAIIPGNSLSVLVVAISLSIGILFFISMFLIARGLIKTPGYKNLGIIVLIFAIPNLLSLVYSVFAYIILFAYQSFLYSITPISMNILSFITNLNLMFYLLLSVYIFFTAKPSPVIQDNPTVETPNIEKLDTSAEAI
jgi:hypothetical protein